MVRDRLGNSSARHRSATRSGPSDVFFSIQGVEASEVFTLEGIGQ